MGLVQQAMHSVLNMFSSPRCGLCDRPTRTILCYDCQSQFHSCQYANPQQFWRSPLPVFAWGQYSGVLKRSIAALKYDNQPAIAQLFGQWLGEAWIRSPLAKSLGRTHTLLVVPVPANAAKKKRRGYDQAELIAQAFCRYTRLPLERQLVIRTEDTVPMYGLSRQARQRNVQGSFQLHPRCQKQLERSKHPRPRNPPAILLLDDIHTSGATLNAIAHLLRQHQMRVYGAVTLAKAGLGQDDPSPNT